MTPNEKAVADMEEKIRSEERVSISLRKGVKRTKADVSMEALRKRLSEVECENRRLLKEHAEAYDTGFLSEKKESDETMKKQLKEAKRRMAAARDRNEKGTVIKKKKDEGTSLEALGAMMTSANSTKKKTVVVGTKGKALEEVSSAEESDDDDDYIKTILAHKSKKDGEVELVVRWKSGEKQTVAMEIVLKDEANKVISYVLRNAKGNKVVTDYLDRVMAKLAKKDKSLGNWKGLAEWATRHNLIPAVERGRMEAGKAKRRDLSEDEGVLAEKKRECNHVPLELRAEDNSTYCGKGSKLDGVQCHDCQAIFVVKKAADMETAKTQFVPRSMHAGYSCRNVKDCRFALCFDCYQKQVAAADGKGRQSRSKDL
jgi:hypothetical protein